MIRLALAVVPPMSKPMHCSRPRISAIRPAAIIPATGPDSIIVTGWTRAWLSDIVPPFERMIWMDPPKLPSAQKAFQPVEVSAHARADIGV